MNQFNETTQIIESATAMQSLGESIARSLVPGDVLLLHGDLGAGKTTLAQGIARGLGISQPVTSPTFTLVAEYGVTPPVHGIERLFHLDLYRLNGVAELDSFGFDELLTPERAVSLIEWPERAEGLFPPEAVVIEIEPAGTGRRQVRFRVLGGS